MTANRADTADATPESGIIWAYHSQPDGSAEPVPPDAVERALADPVGWTWVHLSLADTRCRAWIGQHTRCCPSSHARRGSVRKNTYVSTCSATKSSASYPACSRRSVNRPTPSCGCASC